MRRLPILLGAAVLACGGGAPARAVTSYAEMSRRLQIDSRSSGGAVQLYDLGPAAVSLRPIWMARLAPPRATTETLRHSLRAMILCRQHGDEPVSTEAALRLIDSFAAQRPGIQRAQLSGVCLYIVPMVNPDGADGLVRDNGVGADLNRDWGPLTQPETKAVYDAYRLVRPQLVVDMHSWTATDMFKANSVEACRLSDATSPAIAARALALQSSIIAQAGALGQPMTPFFYSARTDPTLCHRYFAQEKGVVSLLVETAAGGDSMSQMQSRIALDTAIAGCLARSLRDDRSAWLAIARAENASVAPESVYTASSADLRGLIAARDAAGARAAADAMKPDPSVALKSLGWALAAYIAACIVLARFAAPTVARALGRFAAAVRRTRGSGAPAYLSARKRMFPESPLILSAATKNADRAEPPAARERAA